jgi:Fic family protein
MIMNLRTAYDHILEKSKNVLNDPIGSLQTYHSILMHGLLESEVLGRPRKSIGTAIFGSGYIPLSRQERLEKELNTLIDCLSKINDPFEKALYASSNLEYLQFFEDGNKRTSRLFQNAILMANNLPPVLFPISEIKNYIDSTIYYYEHGDHILNRALMINAYRKAYVTNEVERQTPNIPT